MKKFNLHTALKGAPVKLRNGNKAFITNNLLDTGYRVLANYPLRGYEVNDTYITPQSWTICGRESVGKKSTADIIGMWEEPKIGIEDLPNPFRPEIGDEFFYLSVGTIKYCSFYSDLNADLMRNGQCFKTKEDAQKWLNLMKSMLE